MRWPPRCLISYFNALWEFIHYYLCLSVTKSCKSCCVCPWRQRSSVSPPPLSLSLSLSLSLYGILTKTLRTAQAHFAVRHASVKHKNKLTENAQAALYPPRSVWAKTQQKRARVSPPPPLRFLRPKFRGRPGETIPSACLFDPCLIYQAPRRITVGIQRCEATKFVAFRRSSVVG